MTSREDLKKALEKIGRGTRFPRPGQFFLCKKVYGDDGGGDAISAQWECSDYFEEGVNELYKALNEGKSSCDKEGKR